jgi:L-seryl-tRNA(Ser) seleniumtransferase
LYANPDTLTLRIPTLRLLTRSQAAIQQTANVLLPALRDWAGAEFVVDTCEVHSQIGSGSLPLDLLPSVALRLRSAQGNKRTQNRMVRDLALRLRQLPQPVIGRIADDSLLLDCRCVEDAQPLCSQWLGAVAAGSETAT